MFSGGLDSLGALWLTLNDPQYTNVHVHHINIVNIENRGAAEAIAVKRCLKYIADNTTFKPGYTESTIAVLQNSPKFAYDSDMVSFVAGNFCLNYQFTHLVIGMHADDFTRQEVQQRVLRSQRIFEAFDTKTEKIFPIKHLTKQEVFDLLPRELRTLAWSCRTPTYIDGAPQRCDHCSTCAQVNLLKEAQANQ